VKIACITDTHWGCRSDSPDLLAAMTSFYETQFFPYLKRHQIKTVCHLGDIVDRRKYIQFPILSNLKETFMRPMWEQQIDLHILIGNHDIYYRNTNSLNAMRTIFGRFDGGWEPTFYEEATTVNFDGREILMLPWITPEQEAHAVQQLKTTTATAVMGHLELDGFEMYRGMPTHGGGHSEVGGFDQSLLTRFSTVLSGHFHHKSDKGNIHYLGAPYEMTWSDYDDPRGFHVLDTDTLELEFIPNPARMFHKLFYTDRDRTPESVLAEPNPWLFDQWMGRLQAVGCIDISVVEDHYNAQQLSEADLVDQAEDTLTILSRYVSALEGTVDRPAIDALLRSLHSEALNMEASIA
jgi:DNA repair exonuclease SbcCD nuclease subunit